MKKKQGESPVIEVAVNDDRAVLIMSEKPKEVNTC
jgi:hypothetical protein